MEWLTAIQKAIAYIEGGIIVSMAKNRCELSQCDLDSCQKKDNFLK